MLIRFKIETVLRDDCGLKSDDLQPWSQSAIRDVYDDMQDLLYKYLKEAKQ